MRWWWAGGASDEGSPQLKADGARGPVAAGRWRLAVRQGVALAVLAVDRATAATCVWRW